MSDHKDRSEPALSKVDELVCETCIASLRAAHRAFREFRPADAFKNTGFLADYASQAANTLDATTRADAAGEDQEAAMHWASALVLMDVLKLESGNILNDPMVLAAVETQKCGKTG